VSLNLIDLIIGIPDKRQMIGGYSLERVPDWKNNLLNVVPFLTMSSGAVINIGRMIQFEHTQYTGDGSTNPLNTSQLKAILKVAEELSSLSGVTEQHITFTDVEFKDILSETWEPVPNSETGGLTASDKIQKFIHDRSKNKAVNDQLTGIASFPLRVVARNIKAALVLTKFVEEAIEKSKQG
jgi:hypothetical protein